MTPTETATTLRHYNAWRRGNLEDQPMPDPREIGLAIDAAVEMIERLEEAESDALEQARLNGMSSEREASLMAKLEAAEKAVTEAYQRGYETGQEEVEKERDALRAKIEQMEQQEPVGVLHVGSYYGEELQDWEFEADQRVCDRLNERHITNPTSLNLYALPGAQSVPDVDALAQLIREIDGKHQLGAGALAERIVEWLAARKHRSREDQREEQQC